jgi:hypothetical protein
MKTFDFVVEFEVDCAFGKDCVFEVGCSEVDDLVV